MQAVCGHVDVNTLPRVAQLLAKTNQLNLTTRRHSAAQLQKLMDNGALALWLRLSDRFGDHGLVGVIVGVPQLDGRWLIDTMLLSCRVIGRQAERVLLAQLGELVSQKGGRVLTGEYIPTDKNSPAEQVFRVCDFSPADTAGRLWEWDLSETQVPHPDFIPTHFEVQARG